MAAGLSHRRLDESGGYLEENLIDFFDIGQ